MLMEVMKDGMNELRGIGSSEGNDEVLTSSSPGSFIQARLDAEVVVQVTGQQRKPWDDNDISDAANHGKSEIQFWTSST
jgi:hypothetical protein